MASLLARLGAFSARRAWAVIIGWVVILGMGVGAFTAFGGSLAASFSIPDTPTTQVTDDIAERLDGASTATATVVFHSDEALTSTQRQAISDTLNEVATIDGVGRVIDPFATETERAEQAAQLSGGEAELELAATELANSQQLLDDGYAQLDAAQLQLDAATAQFGAAANADAQVELDAQRAGLDEQQAQLDDGMAELETSRAALDDAQLLIDASEHLQTVSDDGTTAVATLQFDTDSMQLPAELQAEVVDTLTAIETANLQVWPSNQLTQSVDGLLGPGEIVGVSLALIVLLIMLRSFLPAIAPILTSVIGVGVGVTATLAFSDVVDMTSVTPVLGVMLGLAVGIDYSLFIINRHRTQVQRGMDVPASIALANGTSGTAVVFAGATVVIALFALVVTGIGFLSVMGVVAAICVIVAVLVAITMTPAVLSLIGMRILTRKARKHTHDVIEPKPDRRMHTGWAIVRAVVGIATLLAIAIPSMQLRLGLPDGSGEDVTSSQYLAYHATEDAFGAGVNGPLVVAATLQAGVGDDELTHTQATIATELMHIENVVAVAPAGVSAENDYLVFQVIPSGGPNSPETADLVHTLRETTLDGNVTLGVAGFASGNIDVSERLANALPIYLAIVVGLSLLILLVVFRSLLVPVIATLGFALSFAAALGAMVAVYQWGWLGAIFDVHDPGPVLSFAPVIIVGVLFGLAMDYQLFLVSGMREAFVHGTKAKEAVVAGLRNGAPVVAAAAIIMISVFGGFVFSHLSMVRPLGFGLAVGVLFDAFVVRMLLIPALMHLFGRAAWWLPAWLDKALPHVDIEGSSLERASTSANGEAEVAR